MILISSCLSINKLNISTMEEDEKTRAKKLIECFKTEKIKIKIPCLLAYGKSEVYGDVSELYAKVISEAETVRDYYKRHTYVFDGFSPEIVFYIFPIESIDRLRDKEKGFYAGLC